MTIKVYLLLVDGIGIGVSLTYEQAVKDMYETMEQILDDQVEVGDGDLTKKAFRDFKDELENAYVNGGWVSMQDVMQRAVGWGYEIEATVADGERVEVVEESAPEVQELRRRRGRAFQFDDKEAR